MAPPDENESDQLTISLGSQPPMSPRIDSLGPSRSLPARPPARRSSPLAKIATLVATLAALVVFALPSSRGGESSRTLLAQTLARLPQQGLALHDVHCPEELVLERGEPFSCLAQAEGMALRIELTPTASTSGGAIDQLRVRVDGAAGVAKIASLAAQRYGKRARVTCPRRYWVEKAGARQECSLQLGQEQGPLAAVSGENGELALQAPWLDARQHVIAESR